MDYQNKEKNECLIRFDEFIDISKYIDEDCYITLEVLEEDYLVNKNYRKQKQLVDSYFARTTI